MKTPYSHPLPFPKTNANAWLYSGQDKYPYPVPPTEFYPEYTWPRSLCNFAPECPYEDDFSDLTAAKECTNAMKFGCPLFLTQFSEFEEFGECKGLELFEIGQDETEDYTDEDLEKIITNFEKLQKIHRAPLVVLGHGEDQGLLKKAGLPSAGWVSKIWRKGKKFFGDFKDVPKKVVDVIKKKAYRFPSVEIYRNFVFQGEEYGPVLRRVALLGADIPRVKSLDDILARYEEDDEGSFILPVTRQGDQESETHWLGGEPMKKEKRTIPIKEITGGFKLNEEITRGDKVIGKLEEVLDFGLVITIDPEETFEEDQELFGNDSEAKAKIGVAPVEVKIDIAAIKGTFKKGEKVETEKKKKAKVVEVKKDELVIKTTEGTPPPDKGEVIVGKESNAKAMVGKELKKDYPYPAVKKASEIAAAKAAAVKKAAEDGTTAIGKDMAELKSQVDVLTKQITNKNAEIQDLTKRSDVQEQRLQTTESERSAEKMAAHAKEVDRFCEDLKRKGLAPAVIDEGENGQGGLRSYMMALDWQKPIKFSEGEEEKTAWQRFSEFMGTVMDKQADGSLFVPLEEIGQTEDTGEVIPDDVDEEGAKLDREVTIYAEEKKISYPEALDAVLKAKEAEAKRKK